MSSITATVIATGTLMDANGAPMVGATLTVNMRATGGTFVQADTPTTDSNGVYTTTLTVTDTSIDVQALYAGDASHKASSAEVDGFIIMIGTTTTLTLSQQ